MAVMDADSNKMRFLAILVVGVLVPLAASADQSEIEFPESEPITEQLFGAGKRQIETPEVVLQLKYDRGELNRIYLAQFRKNKGSRAPSVPATENLCSDLCHSGLGGDPCGNTCPDMLPVGLKSHLIEANVTDGGYGEPRVAVCPTLCQYGLGRPLCACSGSDALPVAWEEVCAAFCAADSYVLRGCPVCYGDVTTPRADIMASRILSTAEGWTAWCNAQCRQGQGGAACNCDRAPFQ